jgi:hypothetical protein
MQTLYTHRSNDMLENRMPHQIHQIFKKICIFILLCCFSEVYAAPMDTNNGMASTKDEEVKRTVLGIISYTRWVPPPTPINLCIVTPTKHSTLLEKLDASDSMNKIIITKLNYDVTALSTQCDAIYFGDVSPTEQQKVIAARQNKPILILSENNPNCEIGSSFCLNIDSSPITFTVNLDSLARSGVRVDPNVLLLGRKKRAMP